jgi:cysteine-rich repeat protein
MFKKISLTIIFTVVLGLSGIFLFALAQETPLPTRCGDNIIQSPNESNPPQYEKCDDGNTVDDDACTNECGQNLLGWAWSSNFGWLSLNKENVSDAVYDGYRVRATADNEIIGWAWSDIAGWICFGETCNEHSADPPIGNLKATLNYDDPLNPRVNGWAKIMALGDEDGWMSLNCSNQSGENNKCYCRETKTTLCNQDSECPNNEKCINYYVRLVQSDFGSGQRLTLKGWAWNDAFGWIWFSPETSGNPWLQTIYGDIYARGGMTGLNQPPSYNATYKILANGDIINFYSAQPGPDWLVNDLVLNFPSLETRYSNVLGKLDLAGLLCEFTAHSCLNQFGQEVSEVNNAGQLIAHFSQPLGGRIYYYQGNLTLENNSTLVFKNGQNFESGAGTIFIDGNLTIKMNIEYDNSDALEKFRNLASVAWIIKGDLKIDPGVTRLAGDFIVLGQGDSCQEENEVANCGQIYSCYPPGDCSDRLVFSGLVMARKYYFDREYFDPNETPLQGSEVIIYDGRLLANTPPGLGDFAKALPIWRPGLFE